MHFLFLMTSTSALYVRSTECSVPSPAKHSSTWVSGLATSPSKGPCLELDTWVFYAKSQKAQHLGGSRPCSQLQPLGFPWDSFCVCTFGEKDPFPLPVFLTGISLVYVNPFMSVLKSFTVHLLFIKFIQSHCWTKKTEQKLRYLWFMVQRKKKEKKKKEKVRLLIDWDRKCYWAHVLLFYCGET